MSDDWMVPMSDRFLQKLSALILAGFFLTAVPAALTHIYANGELDSDHGCAIGHSILVTVAALLSVALPTLFFVPFFRLVLSGLRFFDLTPLFSSATRAPPV